MKVNNLSNLSDCLKKGLIIRSGPFHYLLRSSVPDVINNISQLYAGFPTIPDVRSVFSDFHVTIKPPSLFRSFFHQQVQFYLDDRIVFNPFPLIHATVMLEWGMNWCVSTQIQSYLIIHAAVIERNGLAAILPAPPGSGKSTLCASLIHEGWRLLSDELALIDLDTLQVVPMPRPVGLKNQSIDVVKQRYPSSVFGVVSSDTLKGSVCHIKPPQSSIEMQDVSCPVGWIIFPRYQTGAASELRMKSKAQSFMEIANNSFNYSVLGSLGFDILRNIVDRASCYSFKYSQLDEAIQIFADLKLIHEI